MKDRKKDLESYARPVLARGAETRPQSFTCMEIDTDSGQARRGLACALWVLAWVGRLRQPLRVRMKGSERVQGATTPPMPQWAAQALW